MHDTNWARLLWPVLAIVAAATVWPKLEFRDILEGLKPHFLLVALTTLPGIYLAAFSIFQAMRSGADVLSELLQMTGLVAGFVATLALCKVTTPSTIRPLWISLIVAGVE